MMDGLNAPCPLQFGKPADAAADGGGAAQKNALFPRQRDQLVKACGNQGLVRGGHVLSCQNGAADIFISGVQAADGLHHGVNFRVVQDILKVMGHGGIRQLQIPAAQHPCDGHILPACDDLINAPAHSAEAQKSDLHSSLYLLSFHKLRLCFYD